MKVCAAQHERRYRCAGICAELQGVSNVILTPHIGGSTEEAQAAIGREVANALVKYVNTGSTAGAVNFPQVTRFFDP